MAFDGKPSSEVRAHLKDHGFRWDPKGMVWHAPHTHERVQAAQVARSMHAAWAEHLGGAVAAPVVPHRPIQDEHRKAAFKLGANELREHATGDGPMRDAAIAELARRGKPVDATGMTRAGAGTLSAARAVADRAMREGRPASATPPSSPEELEARRAKKAAETLRGKADALANKIHEKRNPATANQNPTRRRAGIMANMAREADNLETHQRVLRGLADMHEAGTLPAELKGITSRQTINTFLHVDKNPRTRLDNSTIGNLIDYTRGERGAKDPVYRMGLVRYRNNEGGSNQLHADEVPHYDKLAAIAIKKAEREKAAGGRPPYWADKYLLDRSDSHRRMLALGIKHDDEYTKVRDMVRHLAAEAPDPEREKAKRIKDLETGLIGRKIDGYFPTPKPLIAKMLEHADIQSHHEVLEPSAGKGNIADAIHAHAGVKPDVIEPVSDLRSILEHKGHNLVGHDFMHHQGKQYDRIVMNPPFEKGQDADHITHAFNMLKPGGKLVAIASESPFFKGDSRSQAFRDLVEAHGHSEKNPDGSFTGKDAERQTGVATRTVVLHKPHRDAITHNRYASDGSKEVLTHERGGQAIGFIGPGKHLHGEIVGISHANQTVTIKGEGMKNGIDFGLGSVYKPGHVFKEG